MSNKTSFMRRLTPDAIAQAKEWRKQRIQTLLKKHRLQLTRAERSEIRRLTGCWDFWNYEEANSEQG